MNNFIKAIEKQQLLENSCGTLLKNYFVAILGFFAAFSTNSHAGFTTNQTSVNNAINKLCPLGVAGEQLQARCNALVTGRSPIIIDPKTLLPVANSGTDSITDGQLANILGSVTTEQTAAQGTNANEIAQAQFSNLGARVAAIRQGKQGGIHLSGLSLRGQDGKLLSHNEINSLTQKYNKTAAGDDVFDRLGVFVNGNFGFGDRVRTINELGYDIDEYGTTAGIDYRFTDNFVMGAAFGYNYSDTEYVNGLGNMDTDAFTGAVYATYYTDSGFFVDGFFSGTALEYETRRNINYTVSGSAGSVVLNDRVNTSADGQNEGQEYNVSFSSGYNFSFGGLTVTPLVRVDYIDTQIDALDETGGQGWALHIDEQEFNSLTTAVGAQTSYAFSFPWGVLMPTARAEWVHEFSNDSRTVTAHYIQDPTRTKFNILTDNPDRDFVTLAAGLSAQFTHGISAFVNYETVVGHDYIEVHSFSTGVRLELDF